MGLSRRGASCTAGQQTRSPSRYAGDRVEWRGWKEGGYVGGWGSIQTGLHILVASYPFPLWGWGSGEIRDPGLCATMMKEEMNQTCECA